MRDGMRRSVGLALWLGLLCGLPVLAQGTLAQETTAPRPWSDPPTKAAEAPVVPEAKKPAEPAAATRVRADSVRTASQPTRVASRPRRAERPAPARYRAEPRERVAARPVRRPLAEAPRRVATFRSPPEPRPVRMARPLPPDMAGYRDVDLWVDARADRIRRARDGGFLVMRRSTLEDPMGRRMEILRALDDEDE